MKKKLLILLVAVVACCAVSNAQGRRGLRINEIMVQNVFITNDSLQPKKYPVPLGDVNTEIPPRQHIIFWADSEPSKGTFHLSFSLTPGQDNWIGVYDANGITLIDSITVPASLLPNTTYARILDGIGTGHNAWEVRQGTEESYITPSSANRIVDTNRKVDRFAEEDANGFGLTIMAMCIVFSALLLLSLSFYAINRIGARISSRNKMRSQGVDIKTVSKEERPDHDSGEEIAAIVMALNEHINAHDLESTILTINKVRKSYSPWSSKIYGLRELPRR